MHTLQVPEDDGDMPHPLRLTNTSKIYSPYTNTIYRKVGPTLLRQLECAHVTVDTG